MTILSEAVLIFPRLLAPWVRRALAQDRDIVAKHALPIIKERLRIVEAADEKGVEPDLPVGLIVHIVQAYSKFGSLVV